ncbi:MAG: response regulator transcription factor [Cyclobacteriaceae bacterium]|jgi:DNA-binding response OmpR family regulator|nr:response regulator transcription factor [Cyclobacteriaceae bacterium]
MRILIVEDEAGIVSFLKQGLEEEGFVVESASDGQTGLQLALTEHYDLLLLDWMLPKLSGIELCRSFREQESHTPVIFLTAKDTVQDTITGLKSGANDYIKKPFHFEELLERIRVQLRSSETPHVLTLGPITVNTETHEVQIGITPVSLTHKEFQLLEYLLRHKGKVCKRHHILDSVWGMDGNADSGVIDVYINALRKKLNLQREEDYIQTIRGVGYIAREK